METQDAALPWSVCTRASDPRDRIVEVNLIVMNNEAWIEPQCRTGADQP